jgi:hypothetical protein
MDDTELELMWTNAIRNSVFTSHSYELHLPDGSVLCNGLISIFGTTTHTIDAKQIYDDIAFRLEIERNLTEGPLVVQGMWKVGEGVFFGDAHLETLFETNESLMKLCLLDRNNHFMFAFGSRSACTDYELQYEGHTLIDSKAWLSPYRNTVQNRKYDLHTDSVDTFWRIDRFASAKEFLSVYGARQMVSVRGG